MRIAITGSSGLVGSTLVPSLRAAGHEVIRVVRRTPRAGEVEWNPENGKLEPGSLEGIDAAFNLAGRNIATRWTAKSKREIRESRVRGTRLLAETMARLSPLPRALISVSAVGFYGDRGDEVLHEGSGPGHGFLPSLAQEWEASTAPATGAGIRVVNPRFGIILSPDGGALAKMLPPFKFGLGGQLGRGTQWMSWIAVDDVIAGLRHLLQSEAISGAVNLVAPGTVTNREFTQTLAQVLSRPAPFIVPAPALYLAYGRQMPRETLLASSRVVPDRLVRSGYQFRFPELRQALMHVLEKPAKKV